MSPAVLTDRSIKTSRALVKTMERNQRSEADLAPGVYPGLDMNAYLAIPAASNTALGHLQRTASHLRAYLRGKPTFVDPQSIGRAFHALALEGEEAFLARYARAPKEADNKGRKPWLEWVRTVPESVIPMKATDFDAALEMGRGLREDPVCAFALEGVTQTELTVVWIDEATGVKCKARIDALNPSLGTIIDLKSTTDAAPRAFSRSIYNYGYYRQAAFYHAGAKAGLGFDAEEHICIAHEKEDPWVPVVYRIREDAVTAGHDEIWGTPTKEGLLPRYARCLESDVWPGYTDQFVDITLPPWAWAQVEKEGVYA